MGKLLEELKRRKVFRVAAVYAVVAWILIQVSDVVLPTFGAPEWVNQTIIFLFMLGILPTLIAAWAYEITPEGIKPDIATQSAPTSASTADRKLIYATFLLVLLAVGFQLAERFLFSSEIKAVATSNAASVSNLSRRYSLNLGSTAPLQPGFTGASIALSPDGSKLVYSVSRPGADGNTFYLKYLDQLEAQELFSGLIYGPFLSADGEWLGFNQNNALHKVPIQGGGPQLLVESSRPGTGVIWSANDTVYYTSNDLQLMRVSANGGVPEPVNTDVDYVNSVQSWPYLLPGDDAILYTVASPDYVLDGHIDLLIQSTGEVETIIQNGYNASYVPTGHIVFARDAALWAVPFDADRLQITGPERRVLQGVQTNIQRGSISSTFSDDGLLVYLPGGDTRTTNTIGNTLIWVDREGNEEALPQVRNFRRWSVSPDGQRLAVTITEGNINADIWIYDLIRNTVSRLTFDESNDYRPLWTPDGERIVFGSARDGGGLWWRSANGTGVAERLLADNNLSRGGVSPYAFTPDGTKLLYWSGNNIYTLTPGDEAPSQPLVQTNFNSSRPDLSPDGRWLAYGSNETGRDEIYVRPFPNIDDGKWQISNAGGRNPKWSPDGLELFFVRTASIGGDNKVWVAQRETADSSEFNTPVRAFEGSDAVISVDGTFDISADGSRLLLQRENETTIRGTENTELIAVENWFEELKRLAPPDPQ